MYDQYTQVATWVSKNSSFFSKVVNGLVFFDKFRHVFRDSSPSERTVGYNRYIVCSTLVYEQNVRLLEQKFQQVWHLREENWELCELAFLAGKKHMDYVNIEERIIVKLACVI